MHGSEKWKVKVKSLSPVRLLATPWTAAYQALLSMGFSRQEYWNGEPLPSPLRSAFVKQQKTSHKVSRLANILQSNQTSLNEWTTTANISIEGLPEGLKSNHTPSSNFLKITSNLWHQANGEKNSCKPIPTTTENLFFFNTHSWNLILLQPSFPTLPLLTHFSCI